MTTKDIFRSFRDGKSGERPAWIEAAARLDEPRAGVHLRDTRIISQCTARMRRAILPACDALPLIIAALLTVSGWLTVGYTTVALIFLNACGRHRLRICLRVSDEVARLATAAALPIPLLLPWAESTGKLVRLAMFSIGLLLTMRIALYAVLRAANRHYWLAEPALIVGTGELSVEIGGLLQEHAELGLRPVGFIGGRTQGSTSSLPVLGDVPDIADVVAGHDVRRIIVSFPVAGDAALVSALRAQQPRSADVCVVPPMYELAAAIPASCLDEIWGIPLVPLRRSGMNWSGRAVKRTFDVVASAVLLIMLAPVLLLLIGLMMLTCGRPIFFRQIRVTRSGRVMNIIKLRTVAGTDKGEQWAVSPEDCSRLGRWLRATHLDELPQLLNVLHGGMSLVGPRPERPYFASQFAAVVPRYEDRQRVNSGMTGWAQVHGLIGDTSITERVRFDNYYIEHWSLWLDLVVLVRTIVQSLCGRHPK